MNAEEKKALAATTLKALIENDAEKAAAGFADRISWWQPGEPASYGSPGRDTPNWIENPKFIDDFITRSKQYALPPAVAPRSTGGALRRAIP